MSLTSFPILKGFSNEIAGDIKYVTFLYWIMKYINIWKSCIIQLIDA